MLGAIPAGPRLPSEPEAEKARLGVPSSAACWYARFKNSSPVTLTEPMHRALVLKLFDKETTVTTLAHKGRNTTFLTRSVQEYKLLAVKGSIAIISLIMSRGLS